MIVAVGSAQGSGTVAGRFTGRGAGVVSRPGLLGRLAAPARVTVVSAPPGSGKTVLLRSWTGQAALTDRVAWVAVGRDERDPQRFWLSVLSALRQTAPGSALVRPLTAAPDLDGWVIAERLMKDLAPLEERIWLVIDDVNQLDSDEALRQLELLVMRGPPELRFVLATRHDVRLGLHRLRLEGELTELRAADLRFTLEEARELLRGAGVELAGPALAGRLTSPPLLATVTKALLLQTLVRTGETERAEQALARLGQHDRDRGRRVLSPRCCGSPSTTRTRRLSRSLRSWTVPHRWPGGAG